MSREVGEAKLDLGGVCEERPEGLGYQQRSSSGQGCVEVSYPRARTVIWLRYLLGFSSSLPQLVWDRRALLLLLLLLLLRFLFGGNWCFLMGLRFYTILICASNGDPNLRPDI